MTEPRVEYERRTQQRGLELDALERRAGFLSAGRGIFFTLAAAALATSALGASWSWWTSLPFAAVFVMLVVWHEELRRRQALVQRARAFYEDGLRRLEGSWPGHGVEGLSFRESRHPYDEDLDVLGTGSLFQLLCRARTPMGRRRLASWLLTAADPAEIRARQDAVIELAPDVDEREAMTLLGREGTIEVDADALSQWAHASSSASLRSRQVMSALVTVAMIVALGGWGWGSFGHRPAVVALFVALLWGRAVASSVRRGLAEVEPRAHDLSTLAQLLARVETSTGRTPRLARLRTPLDGHSSRDLRRLGRWLEALDWARNPFFAPLAFVLQWHVQVAVAIEAWRRRHGADLAGWLDAVADFEALQSLASHAFECPDDVFAEILAGPPRLEAEGLAHPLLPASTAVRNDLTLGHPVRMFLVSGSNMSGKSTLLRALGSNVVLAQAGAPVRATRMQFTPLAVAASIRVQDSLLQGASRFRAELVRLRTVLQRSEAEVPLLFLLDEIFHGTHSHDRRIGAQAFLTRLLGRGAIGLVTTHDLALTRIADTGGDAIANVHFEDQVIDGRMCFDYRLRPGVVEKSNALALMEAEGLIDPSEGSAAASDTTR